MNVSKLTSSTAPYNTSYTSASSPLVPSERHQRRVTSSMLLLSPSVSSHKRVHDIGGACLSSPRSFPLLGMSGMSGRIQQMFSGPLRLLSNKCRNDAENGRRVSIPDLVTELVVCEGFLGIAAVCAVAGVSCRWKILAYRPSSFGCNLDFSPFGHRLTAQVFDELIKARRIRLARHNKRLQTVNLWNCCAISFRKSAELVGMCSGLKELRILHNKQRSCSHCVQEHHSTFFSDFSFLMNRCDNLWVRSSTEIFWLGRGSEFVNSTVADVQQWFADYLSVECSTDNSCLARIAQLVNEFGRTVSEGRPMQSGLLFMLTSLRNHAFVQHGELEVLASDEQWIHNGQQIELAYMKFAVRGCTPPTTAPSAHPNAHPHLQQPAASVSGVSTSTAQNNLQNANNSSSVHSSHHTSSLTHAAAGQFVNATSQGTHSSANGHQTPAQTHTLPALNQLHAIEEANTVMEDATLNEGHSFAEEEITHLSQGQTTSTTASSHNHMDAQPVTISLPSQVHLDLLAGGIHPAHAHAHAQLVSPRVCTAPNHVLFIGAPYRWPQPRALSRAAVKDTFMSCAKE